MAATQTNSSGNKWSLNRDTLVARENLYEVPLTAFWVSDQQNSFLGITWDAKISRPSCFCKVCKAVNQSINVKFVGRRYTTRPGAPTVVSGKHDHKVHSWVVFWMYTGVSNVVEVGRKGVPGGWATVGETSFSRSSSCSWQNVMSCDNAQ